MFHPSPNPSIPGEGFTPPLPLPGKPILALRWIRAGLGSTGPRRPGQEAKKSKFSESKSTKLPQESAKGDAKSTKLPVPPYGRERKHAERRLEAPKKRPRDAKGRQRGAKGWPRGRQGRPKGGQGEAKGRQKAAKERPGEAKGDQARPEAKRTHNLVPKMGRILKGKWSQNPGKVEKTIS